MGVQEIISIHSVYALLLVITLGAVRGSVPAVSKVVVLSGLDPVLYAASISLIGGFLLLSINLIIGKITPLTMQVIRFSLIGGFVGITIPHIIFFNGIKTVDVGIASALISGIPIMIYLLSLICKQEIFTFRRFAGVLFGLVGVAIIAGSEITRDSLLISSVIGVTLILLSTIFYASNVVFIAIHLPKDFSRMQAAAWMMIFGSIPIWFYIIAFQEISRTFIPTYTEPVIFVPTPPLLHLGCSLLPVLQYYLKPWTCDLLPSGLLDGRVWHIYWCFYIW